VGRGSNLKKLLERWGDGVLGGVILHGCMAAWLHGLRERFSGWSFVIGDLVE